MREHDRQNERADDLENMKFFSGYLMATIGNFSMKKLPRALTPKSFFKFNNDDTQADDDEIERLLKDPDIINRFRKNGR